VQSPFSLQAVKDGEMFGSFFISNPDFEWSWKFKKARASE